jgi:hypothetical protein
VSAEAASDDELRQDARRRLDEWTATGRLVMSTSKAAR